MSDKQVLDTNELRLRLTNLQYQDMSNEQFSAEVQRIYMEETGEKLPVSVEVVRSSDLKKVNSDIPSSYDGTAIHFYSKEKNTNEIYVISQGSADLDDWTYNIRAMQAGKENSQAKNTDIFAQEAKEKFMKESKMDTDATMIGLSHSLAHNNNTVSQLMFDTFDEIYSANGAQTNYYQQYNTDATFRAKVNKEFSIDYGDERKVYDVNPDQLESFALSYYGKKGANVHQLISSDDPLNAISSNTRGFFTLGDVTVIDTDAEHPGLQSLMGKMPDSEVADLQKIAIEYADMYGSNASNNEIIQKLTGVNMDLVTKFKESDGIWGGIKTYFTGSKEIDDMIEDVNKKFPPLLDKVKKVTSNSDAIFDDLYKGNYISADQKKVAVEEMNNIQDILDDMEQSISDMQATRDLAASGYETSVLGGDIGSGIRLFNDAKKLAKSFENLNKALGPAMDIIGEGHSISEILNALAIGENKAYIGGDMILMSGKNQEIKINISAAVRMYQEGQASLAEKSTLITKYSNAFQQEVTDDSAQQKQKVMTEITDIEGNPSAHMDLLMRHIFSIYPIRVESAQVHDHLQPLTGLDISHIIDELNKTVTESNQFLESTRSGIEKLFVKDHDVSMLFDLYAGGK